MLHCCYFTCARFRSYVLACSEMNMHSEDGVLRLNVKHPLDGTPVSDLRVEYLL